jgi:hypothetical protein
MVSRASELFRRLADDETFRPATACDRGIVTDIILNCGSTPHGIAATALLRPNRTDRPNSNLFL